MANKNFMKELNLQMALDSKKDRFRLLAAMNSNQWIFMWCDEEDNFLGMSSSTNDEFKIDYTFEELSQAIDNAQNWLDIAKSGEHPLPNVSNMYVMAI